MVVGGFRSFHVLELTILAPNDNHHDGYEYFLFKFLSSLLVLFLFLLGFYFFLNTKRRVS